ncbi:hypothetical protein NDU88_003325 [Pleurodeles waltl]|uniref:Uncharacterized protein n=1 Tax=Pleurodeles waltl TaxID=8319 RepID=A0AAV7MRG9_PLEWA|nr:hypothetical protein NDU88_003325 [Pleurodeles waltl]
MGPGARRPGFRAGRAVTGRGSPRSRQRGAGQRRMGAVLCQGRGRVRTSALRVVQRGGPGAPGQLGAPAVGEIPWAGCGRSLVQDSDANGVVVRRRDRMLRLLLNSLAPSTQQAYVRAWREFTRSGACRRDDEREI